MNHDEFITVAHEARDWVVNGQGDFLREAGDGATEVVAKPDRGNTWTCATCGAEAKFDENDRAFCPQADDTLPTLDDLEKATGEEHDQLVARIREDTVRDTIVYAQRSLQRALHHADLRGLEDAWASLTTLHELHDKGYVEFDAPLEESPF